MRRAGNLEPFTDAPHREPDLLAGYDAAFLVCPTEEPRVALQHTLAFGVNVCGSDYLVGTDRQVSGQAFERVFAVGETDLLISPPPRVTSRIKQPG